MRFDPDDYSLVDDESGTPSRRRRRGTAAVLALAAVVPLGFAGWIGWHAVADDHAHGASGDAAQASLSTGAGTGSGTDTRAGADAAGATGTGPSASASPSASAPGGLSAAVTSAKPLAGKVIVIDPGHNTGNVNYPRQINSSVFIGNGSKACDTTGTSTNAGYSEARYTLDVARRLRTLLQSEGAKVILTQDGNRPWGPCVTERAKIANVAHADASISIHADGAPSSAYGFHVILPAGVHAGGVDNRSIVGPSRTLGLDLRAAFARTTHEHYATYINHGTGLDTRSDLGGLNLSKVPKVFIECGNMRNSADAAKMTSSAWRQLAAQGLASGLTAFLAH